MAGDGNYGGNGSVYWEINHSDAGGAVPLKSVNNPKTNKNTDHWFDLHAAGNAPPQTNTKVTGHDPIPVGHIGSGTGKFQVVMRFLSAAAPVATIEAELENIIAAAQLELQKLKNGTANSAELRIDVPAVNRAAPPTGTPANPWEISVIW